MKDLSKSCLNLSLRLILKKERRFKMENCTMINLETGEVVIANSKFRGRWEMLGFVETPKVIPFLFCTFGE